jgi:hypothetical protein
MRTRFAALVVAVGVAVAGCSGGGSSSKAKATKSSPSGATAPSGPTTTVTLPAGITKNDRFCSLASDLAAKFAQGKRPESPQESAQGFHQILDFFAASANSTPPQLAPDIQKLNEFYQHLVSEIETHSTAASLPYSLKDLSQSALVLRAYLSRICGVDDSVFNRA